MRERNAQSDSKNTESYDIRISSKHFQGQKSKFSGPKTSILKMADIRHLFEGHNK